MKSFSFQGVRLRIPDPNLSVSTLLSYQQSPDWLVETLCDLRLKFHYISGFALTEKKKFS